MVSDQTSPDAPAGPPFDPSDETPATGTGGDAAPDETGEPEQEDAAGQDDVEHTEATTSA